MPYHKINISDFIDPASVYADAFAQPVMKVTKNKAPSIEAALKCVGNAIERAVIEYIAAQAKETLQDVHDLHVMNEGEYEGEYVNVSESKLPPEEKRRRSEWESALDEAVEAAIEPWEPVLSANWLGNAMMGTGIHLEGGVEKFAYSLGKEYYKQIVHDTETGKAKSTAQIMSSAGLTSKDVEERLAVHINATKENNTMSNENAGLQEVITKIAEHVGKDFPAMQVMDDIDLASDDDDILAEGAASRLGIDMDDVETLRMAKMEHGDELGDVVTHGIEAHYEGGKKKKAAPKKAPAPEPTSASPAKKAKAEAKAAKAAEVEADEDETVSTDTLAILRWGAKDDEIGKGLGVSRGSFNGYANGKVIFTPSFEQREYIREQLVTKANEVLTALAELDGTEAIEVN